MRLRAALGAHLKYTLRHHFSSRLKSIRRLPKRLRDHHMQQEREYAAIFAGLLAEAGRKGLLQTGFDLSVVRMLAMGALTWAAEWYDPDGADDARRHRRRADARADEGIAKLIPPRTGESVS